MCGSLMGVSSKTDDFLNKNSALQKKEIWGKKVVILFR